MDNIPAEAQIYVLVTCLMAVFFIMAMVRVILLRITEQKLQKANEELTSRLNTAQQDLAITRKESALWREEMQRQFDAFRTASESHISAERQRFDTLSSESRQREVELRASLDAARQLCAELPQAKARILQLESQLTAPVARAFTTPAPTPAKDDTDEDGGLPVLAPLPDVNPPKGGAVMPFVPSAEKNVPLFKFSAPIPPPVSVQMPAPPAAIPEIEQRLKHLEKQNRSLENALHLARQKYRATRRAASGKKRLAALVSA